MTHTVWTVTHPQLSGTELVELDMDSAEMTLRGWVVATVGGVGCAVSYEIVADRHWVTRRAHVALASEPTRTLTIEHDGIGGWTVDEQARPDLATCLDVDLGISPSTNTLPIRRLGLKVGEARTVDAVWVRFPALSVEVLSQTYERRDGLVYGYSSGDFARDLEVDDRGVVIRYGDDLWKAVEG
jgi:hypothetical protein